MVLIFCKKLREVKGDLIEEKPISLEVEETISSLEMQKLDQTEEDTCSVEVDNPSNGIKETLIVPQVLKLDTLSTQIQVLRNEHRALSNEVKGISDETLLGSEVLSALRLLGTECETFKKKYLEESLERKRLYNEVIELKGNIRVFCRCRPLSQEELSSGSSSVVEFDPAQESELRIICSDSSKKQFKFDHFFGPQDSQEAVFAKTSPVVTSVLDGFNVCIFAYGQTGTGKTFTMQGTHENRGVNYRTLEEVFRMTNERSTTLRYELFVSMLEVYNEKIRDLLVENSDQPQKKLEIKQTAEGTQEVPGLVEARVYSTDEVWAQLNVGSQNRAVGSTNANELSSRSHSLLRVTVRGENFVNGQKTKSYLWLVDLAGSERVGRTEVDGERLKESQFINKSLSALGDVIHALASKTSHIPYRNSKLTHLLQSSLGGDCKTLMFVQISPSSADVGETLCSLNFASRVRGIEHGPARKQADPTELLKYKHMAEKIRQDEKETKKLQDSLQSLQIRSVAREQLCRSLQEKVRDLESQLAEERKARLQQETRAAASSTKLPAFSSFQQGQKRDQAEKLPPPGFSSSRPPLKRINNFPPRPSMLPTRKTGNIASAPREDKENNYRATLMKPRRVSVAVKPQATMQVYEPKRRVSIATLRPESHLFSIMTPLNNSSKVQTTNMNPDRGAMVRRSFARDPRRISRIFSPLHGTSRATTVGGEVTPIISRSKFLGSPGQVGSWIPKHPTVVALHKRHFVWSPLKEKVKNNGRRSLLPSKSSDNWK
ncbi:hypothetical protein GIB67_039909 [Kingdonia uniflora]|uniref:Kinesin motor domain-containing protein n=1 Tax=Kingdonia uniflora TaxID=39325 RepID=A0A7J7P463_9MAGN|nr:hypothetical protein GIB67_039909 [Kingdonia uniflora]